MTLIRNNSKPGDYELVKDKSGSRDGSECNSRNSSSVEPLTRTETSESSWKHWLDDILLKSRISGTSFLHSSYPGWFRILWLMIMAGMVTLMVMQINDVTSQYRKSPSVMEIKYEYPQFQHFPNLLICPARQLSLYEVYKKYGFELHQYFLRNLGRIRRRQLNEAFKHFNQDKRDFGRQRLVLLQSLNVSTDSFRLFYGGLTRPEASELGFYWSDPAYSSPRQLNQTIKRIYRKLSTTTERYDDSPDGSAGEGVAKKVIDDWLADWAGDWGWLLFGAGREKYPDLAEELLKIEQAAMNMLTADPEDYREFLTVVTPTLEDTVAGCWIGSRPCPPTLIATNFTHFGRCFTIRTSQTKTELANSKHSLRLQLHSNPTDLFPLYRVASWLRKRDRRRGGGRKSGDRNRRKNETGKKNKEKNKGKTMGPSQAANIRSYRTRGKFKIWLFDDRSGPNLCESVEAYVGSHTEIPIRTRRLINEMPNCTTNTEKEAKINDYTPYKCVMAKLVTASRKFIRCTPYTGIQPEGGRRLGGDGNELFPNCSSVQEIGTVKGRGRDWWKRLHLMADSCPVSCRETQYPATIRMTLGGSETAQQFSLYRDYNQTWIDYIRRRLSCPIFRRHTYHPNAKRHWMKLVRTLTVLYWDTPEVLQRVSSVVNQLKPNSRAFKPSTERSQEGQEDAWNEVERPLISMHLESDLNDDPTFWFLSRDYLALKSLRMISLTADNSSRSKQQRGDCLVNTLDMIHVRLLYQALNATKGGSKWDLAMKALLADLKRFNRCHDECKFPPYYNRPFPWSHGLRICVQGGQRRRNCSCIDQWKRLQSSSSNMLTYFLMLMRTEELEGNRRELARQVGLLRSTYVSCLLMKLTRFNEEIRYTHLLNRMLADNATQLYYHSLFLEETNWIQFFVDKKEKWADKIRKIKANLRGIQSILEEYMHQNKSISSASTIQPLISAFFHKYLGFVDGDRLQTVLQRIHTVMDYELMQDELGEQMEGLFKKFVEKIDLETVGGMYQSQNLANVTIWFSDLSTEVIVKKSAYNVWRMLSDIGGAVSLYIGCCVATIVELIFSCSRMEQKIKQSKSNSSSSTRKALFDFPRRVSSAVAALSSNHVKPSPPVVAIVNHDSHALPLRRQHAKLSTISQKTAEQNSPPGLIMLS